MMGALSMRGVGMVGVTSHSAVSTGAWYETVGTANLTNHQTISNNYWATQWQSPVNGLANNVHAYCRLPGGVNTFKMALYSSDRAQLLSTSAITSGTTSVTTYMAAPLLTGVPVTRGSTYWVAIACQGNATLEYDASGATGNVAYIANVGAGPASISGFPPISMATVSGYVSWNLGVGLFVI